MADDPMIDAAVQAYGLRGFPYRTEALDPVRVETDLDLVCHVDGWRDAEEIGEFLAARVAVREPAIVVVAGGSGTGRTSFANYLIRKWVDARINAQGLDFDRQKLIVSTGKMTDYANEEQLWDWVLKLWPLILKAQWGYEPSNLVENTFKDLRTNRPEAMAAALQNALMNLTRHLYTKSSALVGILEDVKTRDILTLAHESFCFVDALLVATVENTSGNFDSILGKFEETLDRGAARMVILGDVNGPEARQVVMKRWEKYSDEKPPFADSVVEWGFGDRARPLVRVLALMEELLVNKLSYGSAEKWPAANSLEFSKDEMREKIRHFDTKITTKR